MLIWALVSSHLCMKVFSLQDHELNQRPIKTIREECICIIRILSSLQKTEYYAILLPNQRVPDAI